MNEKVQIEKQLEFVEWLKKHGIYNEFSSAQTMQNMMVVWEKSKAENELSSAPAGYGAWISVENPPVLKSDENGFIRQRVMVFCEGEILLGYARKSYDGGLKFKADGRIGEWKITHWMPLPDAP